MALPVLGKLLGSGYFGEVYSAKIADGKSPSTRLDVALKRITKQKFRNKNDVQLFMHEIIIHRCPRSRTGIRCRHLSVSFLVLVNCFIETFCHYWECVEWRARKGEAITS